MGEEYSNFKDLQDNEAENYTIEYLDRGSKITIIAPHGGCIEPNTRKIAKLIAGDNFNYYLFIGKKDTDCYDDLHITSSNFDEPKALELVGKSEIVIAIHGCKNIHSQRSDKKEIFIGGLNQELKAELEEALKRVFLPISFLEKFAGKDKNNICNRGTTEAGIQFELTKAFRNDGELCKLFIKTVSDVLRGKNR